MRYSIFTIIYYSKDGQQTGRTSITPMLSPNWVVPDRAQSSRYHLFSADLTDSMNNVLRMREAFIFISQGEILIEQSLLVKPFSSSYRRHYDHRLSSCFNHSDKCRKSIMLSCKQSRRLLECTEDHFPSQAIDGPTKGDAMLDLLLTNASELIDDISTGGCLGCSDRAVVDFTPLRDTGQTKSKIRVLNLRKAKFQLFKDLVNKPLGETILKCKRAEKGWQISKEAFPGAQELSILR